MEVHCAYGCCAGAAYAGCGCAAYGCANASADGCGARPNGVAYDIAAAGAAPVSCGAAAGAGAAATGALCNGCSSTPATLAGADADGGAAEAAACGAGVVLASVVTAPPARLMAAKLDTAGLLASALRCFMFGAQTTMTMISAKNAAQPMTIPIIAGALMPSVSRNDESDVTACGHGVLPVTVEPSEHCRCTACGDAITPPTSPVIGDAEMDAAMVSDPL